MVRLLHKKTGKRIGVGLAVSIPQWCDCCKSHNCKQEPADCVSIPQWCDCCFHVSRKPDAVGEKFQSHNGAIAAWAEMEVVQNPDDGFNPTMVRLLLCLSFVLSSSATGFNPTMVRLLPAVDLLSNNNQVRFQSHNGAIAARFVNETNGAQSRFQSHNGAIAASHPRPHPFPRSSVSIPQWCDCCCVQEQHH